jgi:hypothetical protein
MSAENTREVINKWIDSEHTDTSVLADDVVFTSMNTAEEDRGPEGVSQSINYIYHVAFDARFELTNLIVDGGIGAAEADFVGEHIGEFAGAVVCGLRGRGRENKAGTHLFRDARHVGAARGRSFLALPVGACSQHLLHGGRGCEA